MSYSESVECPVPKYNSPWKSIVLIFEVITLRLFSLFVIIILILFLKYTDDINASPGKHTVFIVALMVPK